MTVTGTQEMIEADWEEGRGGALGTLWGKRQGLQTQDRLGPCLRRAEGHRDG